MIDITRIQSLSKLSLFLGVAILFLTSCKVDIDQIGLNGLFDGKENKTKGEFTIAFGSCSMTDQNLSYFQIVQDTTQPDLWIWLGDIIYADTEDMDVMRAKYDKLKDDKSYHRFITDIPVLGIWDDHDYGKNNAGKDYVKRAESRDELFRFLEVPEDNTPTEGAYQAYSVNNNKIKIILLDVRYFRDQPFQINGRYIPDSTIDMLGETQWNWLEKELASVKPNQYVLVGSGSQIIPDEHPYEKWANFPGSQRRLFDLLEDCKSDKIYLLSGDRHRSEIMTLDLPTKQITEITSSGLTHSYNNANYFEQNKYRQGPQIMEKSYGTMTFSTKNENPKICLNSVEDGHPQYCNRD